MKEKRVKKLKLSMFYYSRMLRKQKSHIIKYSRRTIWLYALTMIGAMVAGWFSDKVLFDKVNCSDLCILLLYVSLEILVVRHYSIKVIKNCGNVALVTNKMYGDKHVITLRKRLVRKEEIL